MEMAITLSKYKLVLNVAYLESDLEELESTAIKALKYYNNTRHIIVYYEDLIKKPYHIIDIMKDPSVTAFWLITMPQIIGGFEYDNEENMRYDQLQDAVAKRKVAKRKPGWVYLQELSWKKYTQPEIMSPPDTLSKAKARVDKRHRRMAKWVLYQGLTVSQFLAADIDNNGYVGHLMSDKSIRSKQATKTAQWLEHTHKSTFTSTHGSESHQHLRARKFADPENIRTLSHILKVDTLNHKLDPEEGKLYTTRAITIHAPVPWFLRKIVGQDICHFVESTMVDAKTRSMQLATRNIGLQKYLEAETFGQPDHILKFEYVDEITDEDMLTAVIKMGFDMDGLIESLHNRVKNE
ncbi:protein slowmo homolog isoform X2 [Tanacetum coccineum]